MCGHIRGQFQRLIGRVAAVVEKQEGAKRTVLLVGKQHRRGGAADKLLSDCAQHVLAPAGVLAEGVVEVQR